MTFSDWLLVPNPLAFPASFQWLKFWFFISLLSQHILHFLPRILIFHTPFLYFTFQLSSLLHLNCPCCLACTFSDSEDSSSKLSAPSFPSGFPVQPRKELTSSQPEPSPDWFLLTCFSLPYWFSVQFPYFFLPRLQVPSSFSLPPNSNCFAFHKLLKFAPHCQLPIPTPLVPTHLLYKAKVFLLCLN